jgi:dsRNA-specific ribonuclease
VVLPISVDPSVRTTSALETWKTERMAKKDAAFEAYKGLYLAGLVNNNLLPARQGVDDEAADFQIPDRPSMAEISPYLDPWLAVAHYQSENPNVYYRTLLKAQAAGEEPIRMLLFTPTPIPNIRTIPMFWNKSKQYTIYSSMISRVDLSDSMVRSLRFVTHKALHSVSPSRVQADKDDFVWLLAPCGSDGQILDISQILKWHIPNDGLRPATELISEGLHNPQSWGLVSLRGDFRKFMVKAIRIGTSSEGEPKLQMTRLPKRRDFLHPMLNVANDNDAHTRVEEFPAAECLVEAFPTPYIIFALFVPSVLYVLTTYMNTDTLRTTLLQSVAFEATHLPLLVRALTSSAADDNNNYQRLEFFGDCILKFMASVHLMADNLNHPEGFLTVKKGRIVSNGYLARASLAAGLDKFIIVKKFTGAKWTPKYTSDLMAQTAPPEKIEKSTKLIADVIESLIGASYIVGGFAKAFSCVQALLPLETWTPMPMANDILYDASPSNDALCSNSVLEKLIGYTFEKKSLLFEALTHGSYTGANAQCSYNRLEFLGDAVLDYIVSRRLYPHSPELPHQTMHGIRSAMVNASFLTFRMFETNILEETTNTTTLQPEQQHRALWHFLRAGHELIGPRDSARKQHELARQQVAAALEHDAQFPWHLLSLTDPPKFLSDIVESVIGAVYVDSHGDISACEAIVRRFGIIDCLDRILRDGVDCFHPKERLGVLIVEKKAKYVRVTDDNEGEGEDAGLYKCQVQVNGKNIGGVVGGLSKLTAETIAAWHANSILGRSDDGDVGGEEASDDAGDAFFEAEEGGGTMLDD